MGKYINIENFRSENLLENGNKNRLNLPRGEFLLSLIKAGVHVKAVLTSLKRAPYPSQPVNCLVVFPLILTIPL